MIFLAFQVLLVEYRPVVRHVENCACQVWLCGLRGKADLDGYIELLACNVQSPSAPIRSSAHEQRGLQQKPAHTRCGLVQEHEYSVRKYMASRCVTVLLMKPACKASSMMEADSSTRLATQLACCGHIHCSRCLLHDCRTPTGRACLLLCMTAPSWSRGFPPCWAHSSHLPAHSQTLATAAVAFWNANLWQAVSSNCWGKKPLPGKQCRCWARKSLPGKHTLCSLRG
eukprot:scaffold98704_cov15-Tisochrysis_lutea.AAC.1